MKHSLNEKYFVQSVKNALKILKLFTPKTQQLSVTEIAILVNLPKSTVHRSLKELVAEGFLIQEEKNSKYTLGFSVLALGGVVQSHKELYLEAEPLLKEFANRFKLPVHICVMEQLHVVYLMREMGEIPMKLITKIGRRNDLHCTAEGLAILAYKSKKMIDHVLMQPLTKYTPYTLTDVEALNEEMANIRKNKLAIAKDTFYAGYSSYAAPIQDYTGEVASSIAVIAENKFISDSQMEREIIAAIQKMAKEISELLGYYE
ncbi:IclR family transcriptional regulator [Lysinibacillus sp. BW-2-10]|uniref:IclR family transcriptional regulator n=1 Tax=Lysinibacillus sp. BW-2-10 TaxID=2590030 RepID=UPI00117F75CD|nr:IclR family transcriptional regulator [Lysinibacillus sp. BW-2-10]TSI02631.1 IclR family transcriptional regulator [Lysinibacillus sp. BW-2-10]